ncbi:MAG: pantoate--beta-alanine ligase [Thermoanaerobaculia bacterium]
MIVVRTFEALRAAVAGARDADKIVGFVPTMGALHGGHLSLLDVARDNGATFLVVSVFVNPTQFGPGEDFETYPRNEERDRALLQSRGVDVLFLPTTQEMYPPGFATVVTIGAASRNLEGERRPGHFDGVATVVLKLLNAVQPDFAVFGQKDAQQCAVVRHLVRDLNVPVAIYIAPTIRDADGLAMSSRNAYLSAEERALAPQLYQALRAGERVLREDGDASVDAAERAMNEAAAGGGMEIDYLRLVDPETFDAPADLNRDLLLVGAVRVGRTRLIDNLPVERTAQGSGQVSTFERTEA